MAAALSPPSRRRDRISFPAVLHPLHGLRATGVVQLCSFTRKRKALALCDGDPVAMTSNLKSETLGDFLERKGRITHAIYEESLSPLSGGRRPGEILVAMNGLSEEEAAGVLLELADAKFFEISAGREGPSRSSGGRDSIAQTRCVLDAAPRASSSRAAAPGSR